MVLIALYSLSNIDIFMFDRKPKIGMKHDTPLQFSYVFLSNLSSLS